MGAIANARRCSGSDANDEAAALVCFQTRSPQNEAIFLRILKEEFLCFEVTYMDASKALSNVQWPTQVQEGAGQMNLPENFPLLRLRLREGVAPPKVEPTAAGDETERKP